MSYHKPNVSLKSSPDKGTQGTGRSRGKGGYPVPWSIGGQEPAPKFPGEKLRHISDLTDEEFGRFMQKYPERLEVYEKVDGAVAMTFGVDENGYWSAKKTGPKRRSAVEYQGKHDAACREAHIVAHDVMHLFEQGTFFSADILYGARPNTIKYDGRNRIVAHGLYEEATGRQVHDLNGMYVKLENGWSFDGRIKYMPEHFATTLVLEGTDRQLTESAIVAELSRIPSQYGGEFVEGLVVRDPETGDLVKIVDKEVFTKRNQQFWEFRDELDRGRKTPAGWKKGIKAVFRESYAERVLGTRSVLGPKPKLEAIRINRHDAARNLTYDTYLAAHAVNSLYEEWGYKRDQFPSEIVERTESAFDETFEWIGEMNRLGRHISEGEDLKTLVRVFAEGLRYDREKDQDLKAFVAKTFSPIVKKLNPAGVGYFSDVYQLQDGRILKLTTDESDADSAFKLRGKNLPGIVHVYDVGKMPARYMDPSSQYPIYYILTEQLEPLPDSEQKTLSTAAERMYLLFNPDRPPFGVLPWEELKQAAYEQADVKKTPKLQVHAMLSVLEKFDVPKIADTLAQNNVYALYDWNGGNIMKRGSEHVLVDFGSGKTSPVQHKSVGEAKERPADASLDDIRTALKAWAGYTRSPGEDGYQELIDDLLDALEGTPAHAALERLTKLDLALATKVDATSEDWAEQNLAWEEFKRTMRAIGVKHPLLREQITEASGGRTATVGLTIGRFQPFHKDHARLIRQMAERYDKVVIAVAGNKLSADNPFPFELRKELMELSLPDVEPKLEVYQVDSGHLPSILSHVASSGGSSYKEGMAIEVVVGEDRVEDFKAQVDRAVQNMEAGPDMSAVRVLKSPFDRNGAVSGKEIRTAIADAETNELAAKAIEKMMDPHVSSKPEQFEEVVARMKAAIDEVKLNKTVERVIREFLTDIAPTKNKGVKVLIQIVKDNRELLKARGIDVSGAEYLGRGSNGAAWRLKDGRIFKVTTDDAEAKIAQHIRGRKLEHVYHVEDVFAFPGTYGDRGHMQKKGDDVVYPTYGHRKQKSGGHYVYGLIQEGGLEKPSEQELKDWERMERTLVVARGDDPDTQSISTSNLKRSIDAMMAHPKLTQAQKRDVLQLIKDFGVHEMVAELKRLGIEFSDFHKGNFMKRGDTFVVIDLGTGGSQESERPSMVGEVKERPDVFSREELNQALVRWIVIGTKEEDEDEIETLELGISEALPDSVKTSFDAYLQKPRPSSWTAFVKSASQAGIPMAAIQKEAGKQLFESLKEDDDVTRTTAKGKPGLHLIGGETGAQEIVDRNRERLGKIGIVPGAALGHGTMGVAIDAGNNRVLKVTVDKSEAASNATLVGKEMKHVNRAYKVFRFPETNDAAQRAGVEVFGILGDKLQKLSADEERDIEEIGALLTHKDVLTLFATAPWEQIEREFYSRLRQQTARELGDQVPDQRIDRVMQRRRQHYDQLFKKYQIAETIDELRSNGVQFADYHAGNVMKRGSDYVVSDLSLSKTPGNVGEIDILEMGDFANKAPGTSAWSSGMMASVGRDDTEDRDRLLGWAGRKTRKTEGRSGRSRRSRGTRTGS